MPTWIMLRAGVKGLEGSHASAPVQPLLLPVQPAQPIPVLPPLMQERPHTASHPPLALEAKPPVLERKSTVDTQSRPVRKKAVTPPPPAEPTPVKPKQKRKQKKHRIAEKPCVERPDRPQLKDLRARSYVASTRRTGSIT